jgi:hypothetical protein
MILFMGDPWLALAYEISLTSFDQYTLVNTFSLVENFLELERESISLEMESEGRKMTIPAFHLHKMDKDSIQLSLDLAKHLIQYRAPFIFAPYSQEVADEGRKASYDIIFAQSPLGQGARAEAFAEAMAIEAQLYKGLTDMQRAMDINGGRVVSSLADERDLLQLFDTEGGPPQEFIKVALDFLVSSREPEERDSRAPREESDAPENNNESPEDGEESLESEMLEDADPATR